MSQSPRAVKVTDKRVDYLFKAKQARMEKRQLAWATNGNVR